MADLRGRACIQEISECKRYAVLHRQGLRARGDFPTVIIAKECERAAKTGGSFACTQAAAGYAFGLGVPRDLTLAKRLYGYHCASSGVRNELRGQACDLPKEWQ